MHELIIHHTSVLFTSGYYDCDKQEHFMEGLEDYIQYALLNLRFDDFNHLVDSALNT